MLHYVEKPGSFISTTINCGVYILVPRIMNNLSNLFKEKHKNSRPVMIDDTSSTPLESLSLENDVLKTLTDSRKILIHQQSENFWWTPIKTPSSAIYANRNYLCNYRKCNPELLYSNSDGKPEIIGDVYIDPTAVIDPTAKVLGFESLIFFINFNRFLTG